MPIVNSSRWPLVSVNYPAQVTDDFIEELGLELLTYARGEQPFVLIVDATTAAPLTAKQRARVVSVVDDNREAFRARCLGQAVVIRSGVARGVLTAMSWLKPPPMPLRAFDSIVSAEQWLMSLVSQPAT